MQTYNYDRKTGLLLFVDTARVDPLEPGKYLIPANATVIAPPAVGKNEAAIFSEAEQVWRLVPDLRGQVFYDTADGRKIVIQEVGEAVEPGWTELAPSDPEDVWIDGHWELPLERLAARQQAVIRSAFEAAVLTPVMDGSGLLWNGGYDSALKLDAALRMAERLGRVEVAFYDFENHEHILPVAAALEVVLTVAAAYQQIYSRKQTRFGQIESALLAADRPGLVAISW